MTISPSAAEIRSTRRSAASSGPDGGGPKRLLYWLGGLQFAGEFVDDILVLADLLV